MSDEQQPQADVQESGDDPLQKVAGGTMMVAADAVQNGAADARRTAESFHEHNRPFRRLYTQLAITSPTELCFQPCSSPVLCP